MEEHWEDKVEGEQDVHHSKNPKGRIMGRIRRRKLKSGRKLGEQRYTGRASVGGLRRYNQQASACVRAADTELSLAQ